MGDVTSKYAMACRLIDQYRNTVGGHSIVLIASPRNTDAIVAEAISNREFIGSPFRIRGIPVTTDVNCDPDTLYVAPVMR